MTASHMTLPSGKTPVYLDYNATAPIRPEVIETVAAVMGEVGNASSVHAFGRLARRRVEDAREALARLVNTRATRIIFTSGGTEANNLALRGAGRSRLMVSAGEHDSVLAVDPEAFQIPLKSCGRVDLEALADAIGEDGSDVLVSVMYANNETGVIQPVREIVELCHSRGALCHCDAVQALGKTPVDAMALETDFLTLSSHKIGGPQGVGALVLGKGIDVLQQQVGGGQERRRRGGTENVAGIAGFGKAAELAFEEVGNETSGNGEQKHNSLAVIRALRDDMEQRVRDIAPNAKVFGQNTERLPNTSSVAMPGVPSDTQLMALDLEGIAVSSGSACSSGKVQASHVMKAMGATDEEAGSVLRFSLGWKSTQEDVDRFVECWSALYERKGDKLHGDVSGDPATEKQVNV
ncbi:cysteine desulfurase family protein [Kiloniella sp. b19]|uniref:cysteine desulfurase family protein n=1 Tax=Kiloniella sp. GXU_MW_B19 TaxID=3141326 RepID=UPI0031D6C033